MKDEMGGMYMREMANTYKILVRIPDEKRPLGRNRHKWEENIEVDVQKK
jgi:hypothetical protein